MFRQQSMEVKVMQGSNRALTIKPNVSRGVLERSCRCTLEGFHFYNSCITVERLREKGVLLKRQMCVHGGMFLRSSYLPGMFLSRQFVHCHAKAGMPMLLCHESLENCSCFISSVFFLRVHYLSVASDQI